jgi:hypothetical protein
MDAGRSTTVCEGRHNLKMPFTLAHAAAALPFRRTKLIQSAVVIGCFVPDFEYFVRLAPRVSGGHTFGHTLPGLFAIDLPLGMAIFWLFHRYAKEPLWTWLPEALRQRVKLGPRTPPLKGAAQSALVLVSILVGATTHILWDSVTHHSYWPGRHWPFLSYTFRLPILGWVQFYNLLQYASTALGTIVVLIWIVRQFSSAPIYPRSVENARVHERRDLMFVSAVALAGGTLRAFVGLRPANGPHRIEVFIAEAVLTAIVLFWIQSVIFGFLRDRAGSHTQTA